MVEKKKALSPNAANGIPVAVPRDSGKFKAARIVREASTSKLCDLPVLMAAVKAEALPAPVMRENTDNANKLYAPGPASYATESQSDS